MTELEKVNQLLQDIEVKLQNAAKDLHTASRVISEMMGMKKELLELKEIILTNQNQNNGKTN